MKFPQHINKKLNIYYKPLWFHPVPNNEEVKKIFELLPEGNYLKVALGFILIGLRPQEVADLTWDCIKFDEKDNIKYIEHFIYKPTNRINQRSVNVVYKVSRKILLSRWLEYQIKLYRDCREIYPHNKMFHFSTADVFNKFFSKIRKLQKNNKINKKYNVEGDYSFLLEKLTMPLNNSSCDKTNYRISPYSFRRFGLSLIHWIYYKGNPYKTIEYSGHSRVDTLMNHYIQSKEAIGLVNDNILFDNFIDFSINNFKTELTIYDFYQNQIKA